MKGIEEEGYRTLQPTQPSRTAVDHLQKRAELEIRFAILFDGRLRQVERHLGFRFVLACNCFPP